MRSGLISIEVYMHLPVIFHRVSDIVGRSSRLLYLAIFWYISCYILMMDWTCPAYDPTLGSWTSESNYYMTVSVRVRGPFSVYGPRTCWANWLFQPIDWIWHRTKIALDIKTFPALSAFHNFRLLLFGMTLLMPFWFSIIYVRDESQKHFNLWTLLYLAPAVWYCVLIFLYHYMRLDNISSFWGKPIAVIGTVVAVLTIIRAVHGKWYFLVVPLTLAIISGTVWLILSPVGDYF
jgi:hypothetical protein